jgi:hypothetical protein
MEGCFGAMKLYKPGLRFLKTLSVTLLYEMAGMVFPKQPFAN